MKYIYITIVFIVLTAFGAACSTSKPGEIKASAKSATQSDSPESKSPPSQPKKLAIVNDVTGSSSEEQLEQPVAYIKSALTESENVVSVDIYRIGANGKQTRETVEWHFQMPEMPSNEFNENLTIEEAKKKGCGNRLACIEREVKIKRNETENEYQHKLASYNETRSNLIAEIGIEIIKKPTKSPRCTDIQEQAEFVAELPFDAIIWLTDGQHNCQTKLTGLDFKNKSVILGILPVKDEVEGKYKERYSELTTKFSNLTIKPITSVNKEAVCDLLLK